MESQKTSQVASQSEKNKRTPTNASRVSIGLQLSIDLLNLLDLLEDLTARLSQLTEQQQSSYGERIHEASRTQDEEPSLVTPARKRPATRSVAAKQLNTISEAGAAPTKLSRNDGPGNRVTETTGSELSNTETGAKASTVNVDDTSKPSAVGLIRHLIARTPPHLIRARLRQGNISNIFDDARAGRFGKIEGRAGDVPMGLRLMFDKMLSDTHGGQCTAANAEYFVQILEEAKIEDQVPTLAEDLFKVLVILVSNCKPPPPELGVEGQVMSRKQVLHVVGKEMRDAIHYREKSS